MLKKKSFLTAFICLVVVISTLTSCNSNTNEITNGNATGIKVSEETEQTLPTVSAQMLEHHTGNYVNTYTAQYYVKYTKEAVSPEEVANNPDKIATKWFTTGKISEQKTISASNPDGEWKDTVSGTLDELLACEGTTVYIYTNTSQPYKITYQEVVLAYLNIKFFSDSLFELSYYINANKDVKRVLINSQNYVITHFIES